jgi:indolepyruvate ferredoxin oxidoreductase alpha subunit
MGGAISMATGVAASGVTDPVIAVVGDGGLLHSGISALVNAVHNESPIVVMVLDNSVLGNTGFQPTAAGDMNAVGQRAPVVDIVELCRGTGVPFLEEVNPLNLEETTRAMIRALSGPKPAVVVAREPCTLLRLKIEKSKNLEEKTAEINISLCTNCGKCMELFCPAIIWEGEHTPKNPIKPHITQDICSACGLCLQLCAPNAIALKGVEI